MNSFLNSLVAPAVLQRVTLLLNHVLSAEPVATDRLRPHANRCVVLQFSGWPTLLPALPEVTFRITRAGLLEWVAEGDEAAKSDAGDLLLTVDASNPALGAFQFLSGQRPRIDVSGDAELAGDVSWLIDNLRWDVQDDLARVIGDIPATQLSRIGGWLNGAIREAAQRLSQAASSFRPGSTNQ